MEVGGGLESLYNVVLIGLTTGITFGMLEFADNAADKKASAETDTSEYAEVSREKESISGGIQGADEKLRITKNSTENDVITEMHSMTHQKVVAEQKWGAIPMSKKNAETVKNIVSQSNFEKK